MLFRRMVLSLLVCSALLSPAAADQALPPAAEWISPKAVLCLEVTNPKDVLHLVLRPQLLKTIQSSPEYGQWSESNGAEQLRDMVRALEKQFGADWQTLLEQFVGGGVTLAVGPGDASVLIVDAENAEMLKQLQGITRTIAGVAAYAAKAADRVKSEEYNGVTTWTFGPKEAHAIIGNRLVISNQMQALRDVLDRRAGTGGGSLADTTEYQTAKKATNRPASGSVFANFATIKQLPNVKRGLEVQRNPMAVLLLAGMVDLLRESDWLALELHIDSDTCSLVLASDASGLGSGAAAVTLPQEHGKGALPHVEVPRQIAAASLYRDLHGFYAAKDDLFPERTSELIFFENMMGIFFTGRDLTEEVLAELGPHVRVVVAEQQYDPARGTPGVKIPAFAVVFRMKNPDKFRPVLEEAWQKAVGLINFTRGQQALPGFIIDRPTHGDTKYTTASFSAPVGGDRSAIDARLNFCPTLAMPGEYVILSSTDSLAEDLIDALKKEASGADKPSHGLHSAIEIDGRQLASILQANRESLIRNNMVEDGNTREQAETAIGMLLTIVRRIGGAKLGVGGDTGPVRAELTLKLNLEPTN